MHVLRETTAMIQLQPHRHGVGKTTWKTMLSRSRPKLCPPVSASRSRAGTAFARLHRLAALPPPQPSLAALLPSQRPLWPRSTRLPPTARRETVSRRFISAIRVHPTEHQSALTKNDGGPALRFESPLWFHAASASEGADEFQSTPVIDLTKVKGINAHDQPRKDATHDLDTVLAQINPKTEILHIAGDTPSNDEWVQLGRHLTNLRALKVETGWDECWVDHNFPLTWPLKLLVIASACGERISTPAVLEGRIEHLVLLLTCGLRFEGPRTSELMKNAEPISTIPREKAPWAAKIENAMSQATGEQPAEIKVYSVLHEWMKWLDNKYGGKKTQFWSGCEGVPPSRMKKLEIVGNDAITMLSYMALARFHLLTGLESLTIHSTFGNDMKVVPPANYFLVYLQVLLNLKELRLTLGSETVSRLFKRAAAGTQAFLHECLPPNLETLYFRGPVTTASQLDHFTAALADNNFLPLLKHISIVLDLPDMESSETKGSKLKEAPLEELKTAKRTCRRLLNAAARRGVIVEDYHDPWCEVYQYPSFTKVDSRWAEIDDAPEVDFEVLCS
ncbi:hypothetical protein VTK56DRAFT_6623 [Thermocarpiscus australiensis]